jgi:hypothetical protein
MSRRDYADTDLRTRQGSTNRSRQSRGFERSWMDVVACMAGGGA